MAENNKTSVAIVGCGGISTQHLKGAELHPEIEVVACADIVEESARKKAEQFDIARVFTDWKEMAAEANLNDCMLCGCCSFVCPSNIPLSQLFAMSKNQVSRLKAMEPSS